MKIDLEDVKFWMDAIRNSEDRDRTLESFWGGQLRSKAWLVETLQKHNHVSNVNCIIFGGWNGVLANMLFNSTIGFRHITSVDIDPTCAEIATTINKRFEIEGKFTAVTADMCEYEYTDHYSIVINTSCEHITQRQYDKWLENVPKDTNIVLQSNNYFDLDEHIRCAKDIDDFISQSNIKPYYKGTFDTPLYNRFMLLGVKE